MALISDSPQRGVAQEKRNVFSTSFEGLSIVSGRRIVAPDAALMMMLLEVLIIISLSGSPLTLGPFAFLPSVSWALDVHPTPGRVAAALEEGRAAAALRTPPDRLYAWFGSTTELEPKGFLMTKLVGVRVMSAHFALRAVTPSDEELTRLLDEPTLLVGMTIFGAHLRFARDSYLVLVQDGRVIKPVRVRADGQATRTPVWPRAPAYQAKVVASFLYEELDPLARTTISVFPADGGELSFDVDFSRID